MSQGFWSNNPFFSATLGNFGIGTTFDSNYRLNSTTRQIAYKFFSPTTSPITHINPYISKTGTVTGINWLMEIQTDSSGSPSGTVLGAATADWAGPSASGLLGEQALGSNTGTLALNTPYWLVTRYSSGTSPDASNYLEANYTSSGTAISGTNVILNNQKWRAHNGTNWTTVTAFDGGLLAGVLKHQDGTFSGSPVSGAAAASGTAIYGTNRQGVQIKYGAAVTISGLWCSLIKTGSPNALEALLYEGATEKSSGSLAALDIAGFQRGHVILFTTPVALSASTVGTLVLRQNADGGSTSNKYEIYCTPMGSGYHNCLMPPDFSYVTGTGNDPTAYSTNADVRPMIMPIIGDPAAAFSSGSGGGIIQGSHFSGGFHRSGSN